MTKRQLLSTKFMKNLWNYGQEGGRAGDDSRKYPIAVAHFLVGNHILKR